VGAVALTEDSKNLAEPLSLTYPMTRDDDDVATTTRPHTHSCSFHSFHLQCVRTLSVALLRCAAIRAVTDPAHGFATSRATHTEGRGKAAAPFRSGADA
jgi:hypothetical protein